MRACLTALEGDPEAEELHEAYLRLAGSPMLGERALESARFLAARAQRPERRARWCLAVADALARESVDLDEAASLYEHAVAHGGDPVSYTHLTLPTICSV